MKPANISKRSFNPRLIALAALATVGAVVLVAWFVLPDAGVSSATAPDARESATSTPARSELDDPRSEPAAGESSVTARDPIAHVQSSSSDNRANTNDKTSVHLFGQVNGLEKTSDVFFPHVIGDKPAAAATSVRGERFGSPGDVRSSRLVVPTGVRTVQIIGDKFDVRLAPIDDDGNYSFDRVPAGQWQLSVHDGTRIAHYATVELAADEREHRYDAVVKPERRICIRMLTPDGGDLSEALAADSTLRLPITIDVVATHQAIGPIWERVQSFHSAPMHVSLRASYAPARLNPSSDESKAGCSGVLVTDQQPPLFVSLVLHDFVLGSLPAPEGAQSLTFVVDPDIVKRNVGTVRLRLVDPLGGSLPEDCSVMLRDQWMEKRAGEIAVDGQIEFTGLTPGVMTLSIRADGCEDVDQRVEVAPASVIDLGTMPLRRWCKIVARVLDPDGKPRSVFFNAFALERFEMEREKSVSRCFRSDASDGELVIDTLGRGKHLLRTLDDNWGAMVVVDTTDGDVRGVVVHLARKVGVTVRLPIEAPTSASWRVTVRAELPVMEMRAQSSSVLPLRLVPGSYTLRLMQGGDELARLPFNVGSEPTDVAMPSWK
jgi:hypothetical protein